MNAKKLEVNSEYAEYDIDGDGVVTDKELELAKEIKVQEMAERKQASQKKMAWVSLFSMAFFTILLFSPIVSDARVSALADLLGLFYIAQAGVVGAYMGMTAYMSRK
jgi:hypothetical protein